MKRVRYPAEFKAEAVKQVTERGHGVVDVAKRLGMSDRSCTCGYVLRKSSKVLAVGKTHFSRQKSPDSKPNLKVAPTYFAKLSG